MVREHIGKISTRKKDSHKGDYGKVLVVAGSPGMTGAASFGLTRSIKSRKWTCYLCCAEVSKYHNGNKAYRSYDFTFI